VNTPTSFDFLVGDVSGCLDASNVHAIDKLLALSVVAVACAQTAPEGETEAIREARGALGDAAARFASAVWGIHLRRGEQ